MLTHRKIITALLALTAAAGLCLAEEPAPAKFFKLDFVIKEVDGAKLLNSRSYSLTTSDGAGHNSIRVGSKVPVVNKTQYLDVGVSIDVINIKEVQNRLSFTLAAEVSSIPAGTTSDGNPVIRQNRWNSAVIVPFKKPTVLFSSDNLDAKSQLQIEVTAAPIP